MIEKYFGCGFISIRGDIVDFHVVKFTDITEKIIPFFSKYQIVPPPLLSSRGKKRGAPHFCERGD
jgi:hypothetical protein